MDFLKTRRLALKWTQAKVAEACGVAQSTISEWESGKRRPEAEQFQKWCNVLAVTSLVLIPLLPRKLVRKMRTQRPRLVLAAARDMWELCATTYAMQIENLRNVPCLNWLGSVVYADSALECFTILLLFHAGATLHAHNPHLLGFDEHLVLGYNRGPLGLGRLPCLLLQFGKWRFILWPQVTVRVRSYVYRVDYLILAQCGRKRLWAIGEIDGPGHNSNKDVRRSERLSMSELRFSEAEACRFPEMLVEKFSLLMERVSPGRKHAAEQKAS
jgi:transcriptional regulator with XRE-family HTH domain